MVLEIDNKGKIKKLAVPVKVGKGPASYIEICNNIERIHNMMNEEKKKKDKEIISVELSDIMSEENGLSFDVVNEETEKEEE